MKQGMLTVLLLGMILLPSVSWTAERTAGPEQDRERKEQYEKSMEERLRKLGKELDELKARGSTLAEQTRKDLDRYVSEAETKRKKAARKLEELRAEGEKKWKTFAAELNAALDEFEKAYRRAKEHFKE